MINTESYGFGAVRLMVPAAPSVLQGTGVSTRVGVTDGTSSLPHPDSSV
jgi:hypothetical protein